MIVANEKQYYQVVPDGQQKPGKSPRKSARNKAANIRKRKALTRVCVALAVGILVISRFAVISEYNYNIRMLERELEELQKANERLNSNVPRLWILMSWRTMPFTSWAWFIRITGYSIRCSSKERRGNLLAEAGEHEGQTGFA